MDKKRLPDKPEVINVPNFWTRVSTSVKPLLALDYDGTLAPFRINRAEAYPLPGIVDLLNDINKAGKTFLAIVSGRPLSEVMSLTGNLNITFVGSHGFEMKYPDTGIVVTPPDPLQLEGLEAARRIVSGLDLGHLIEIKAACVALHTRALRANQAQRVEDQVHALWSNIAVSKDLYCRRFDGGIEVLAKGRNKGDAVSGLIAESGADFSVYIGDDTTDEDVFRFLKGRGIGVRVGDPQVPTMADGFLPDCRTVREFLESWLLLDSGEEG